MKRLARRRLNRPWTLKEEIKPSVDELVRSTVQLQSGVEQRLWKELTVHML